MISYPQLFPGLGLALVLLLGVACHDLPQCSNGATNPPTCTPPSSDTSNRDGYGPTDVSSASDLDDTLSPSDTLGDLISTADGDEPRDASNDGGSDQPADAGFDGTFQDDLSKPSSCNPWAALCSDPGSLVTKVLTYDEVKTRLIRKWLLCSPVSVFSTSDEAGFELKGDGTYAKLLVSSDGQLVAGTGFENEGTWELLDTTDTNGPGSYQLNINYGTGGGNGMFPAFTDGPSKMRLTTMAGTSYYLATDDWSGGYAKTTCP